MAAKGKTKKKDTKKRVIPPKGKENSTTLGDIIKNSDQAIVVTSTKGNVEVTGIKSINYAYEAKGLLVGAMDTYNSKPIITGMNNNTRALLAHLVNINNKVTKYIGPEDKKDKGNK